MASKQKLLSVDPPYLEIERKYDLPNIQTLKKLYAYIRRDSEGFVTYNDPPFLPNLPKEHDLQFEIPLEITNARQRLYYDTEDLIGFKNGIELRQELRTNKTIKQVIKTYEDYGSGYATLVRPEYSSVLSEPGINFKGVSDKVNRKMISGLFEGKPLKPLICMTSQRIRFLYHPDGNSNTQLELALDQVVGECCNGHHWTFFQLELEVVTGPRKMKTIDALLDKEEKRLISLFPLTRNLESKPTPGFNVLKSIETKEFKTVFRELPSTSFKTK